MGFTSNMDRRKIYFRDDAVVLAESEEFTSNLERRKNIITMYSMLMILFG